MLQLSSSITLADWQQSAVDRWRQAEHPTLGHRHGIIEAVTGTGKTLAAIACMADAASDSPGLRFAIVVPSQQLARQWAAALQEALELPDGAVGLRMSGHRASLQSHRFVVWVIDSARRALAADCKGQDVMLVVDECHRSGSAKNRRIYDAPTRFRLGLSATAQRRGEVGADGLVLPLEQQAHARALGPTFVRLTVAKAEAMGILPPFQLIHHGISLSPSEQLRYEVLSRTVRDALANASALGLSAGSCHAALVAGAGARFSADQVAAARAVQVTTLARKHFLYLRPERARVAAQLVAQALRERASGSQALLFHERIAPTTAEKDTKKTPATELDGKDPPIDTLAQESAGADSLFELLMEMAEEGQVSLSTPAEVAIRRHHTQHPDPSAFVDMRRPPGDPQRAQVLVSVKGAVEGVDLPNADVGIVVASSSSIRQRIQTLGRILRPLRDPDGRPVDPSVYDGLPPRTLHLIYVHGTVDAKIYEQTDWDELLGADRNHFRRWELGAEQSTCDEEPPEPPFSDAEAAAWAAQQLDASGGFPVPWPGRRPAAAVQTLYYRRNAIRSLRNGPPIDGGEDIAAFVDGVASELGLPSTDLRGELLLRLEDALLIRAVPQSLGPLRPVEVAGRAHPIPTRWLVLGRCGGLPSRG
jgi:superfamily II DNA or RNA helicase